MQNARSTALKALYNIEKSGAYINIELKKCLDSAEISDADKRLATEICHGTVKYKINLDFYIKNASSIKINKISPYVKIILRMGVYQIKYMDKIPVSAAVNESVKLAKRYGGARSGGFVNAVLKKIANSEVEYPKDKAEFLSVKYSYPLELCEKFISDFGFDFAKDIMEKSLERPKIYIRVNTLKISVDEFLKILDGEGVEYEKSTLCADAVRVSKLGFLLKSKYFPDGLFYVQDLSSMLACKILAPKKGASVLDICAAPGGKSTYIAQLMQNDGEIYSSDIYEHKIKLISENAKRLGIDIIKPCISDATAENKAYFDKFDFVLADLPCSGLGIVNKKPEIKYSVTQNDISNLADMGLEILNNCAKYVKKGGTLVFSLCTFTKDEGEENVKKFLLQNKNFALEEIDIDIENDGFITFYPHIYGTDGFFTAKFIRID